MLWCTRYILWSREVFFLFFVPTGWDEKGGGASRRPKKKKKTLSVVATAVVYVANSSTRDFCASLLWYGVHLSTRYVLCSWRRWVGYHPRFGDWSQAGINRTDFTKKGRSTYYWYYGGPWFKIVLVKIPKYMGFCVYRGWINRTDFTKKGRSAYYWY